MSQVSTAFDALRARLGTVFTTGAGYFELTNPYDIQDNQDQFLRKGWGLAVGAGVNTNRNLCKTVSVEREFRVVLTQALEATEFGIDDKQATVKELLESAQLAIESFEREFALDSGSYNTRFVSDSGISSLAGENFSFLTLELSFNVELFDNA